MISKKYVILSPEGLHARPATALLRVIKKHKAAVTLKVRDNEATIKGILSILSLSAQSGEEVSVTIQGEDETAAAAALDEFFTVTIKNM